MDFLHSKSYLLIFSTNPKGDYAHSQYLMVITGVVLLVHIIIVGLATPPIL